MDSYTFYSFLAVKNSTIQIAPTCKMVIYMVTPPQNMANKLPRKLGKNKNPIYNSNLRSSQQTLTALVRKCF